MSADRERKLIEQEMALGSYLDALLIEMPTHRNAPDPAASPAAVVATKTVDAPVTGTAVYRNCAPQWFENEFQALLFTTAGLHLAMPLAELNGLQEWREDRVMPMPVCAGWELGVLSYNNHEIPLVDPARLILPEQKLRQLTHDSNKRFGSILFIDAWRWGLACDQVDRVITLKRDQVRWRSDRTKRRWLAGTALEYMCAVIDPPAFAELLSGDAEDAKLHGVPRGEGGPIT